MRKAIIHDADTKGCSYIYTIRGESGDENVFHLSKDKYFALEKRGREMRIVRVRVRG
jgi:hypothetical protein